MSPVPACRSTVDLLHRIAKLQAAVIFHISHRRSYRETFRYPYRCAIGGLACRPHQLRGSIFTAGWLPNSHDRKRGRSKPVCPVWRHWTRSGIDSWLRRHRGHVGTARGPVSQDKHRDRADLRGMGRSSEPAGGYDKKSQAADFRTVMTLVPWWPMPALHGTLTR
jgi:hypothetical protein